MQHAWYKLQAQQHVGEIDGKVLNDVRKVLTSLPVDDDEFLASWFGRFISTPRGLPAAEPPEPQMKLSQLRSRFNVRFQIHFASFCFRVD